MQKRQGSVFEPIEVSGFEAWPPVCQHWEHNPPTHLVVPAGFRYRHVCPACGHTVYVYPSQLDYRPAYPTPTTPVYPSVREIIVTCDTCDAAGMSWDLDPDL